MDDSRSIKWNDHEMVVIHFSIFFRLACLGYDVHILGLIKGFVALLRMDGERNCWPRIGCCSKMVNA